MTLEICASAALLLLLLAVLSFIVADSRRGKSNWADVQRAKIGEGKKSDSGVGY